MYWLFLRGLVLNTVTGNEWLGMNPRRVFGPKSAVTWKKLNTCSHSCSLRQVRSMLVFHWRTLIETLKYIYYHLLLVCVHAGRYVGVSVIWLNSYPPPLQENIFWHLFTTSLFVYTWPIGYFNILWTTKASWDCVNL